MDPLVFPHRECVCLNARLFWRFGWPARLTRRNSLIANDHPQRSGGEYFPDLQPAVKLRWRANYYPENGASGLDIIDSQVHTWEADTPAYPWRPNYADPQRVAMVRAHFSEHLFPTHELIAAMDAAGVHAGIATVPSIYGSDNRYALAACARYPERLAMIALPDPDAPDMDAEILRLKAEPAILGVRVMIVSADTLESVQKGRHRRILAAAERHGVTMCLYPLNHIQYVRQIADDFPNLRIVIDHLGHAQPPVNIGGADFGNMFGGWQHLLDLAACDNIAVKVSAFPAMSSAPFPYKDLWPRIRQLVNVFGVERLFWGTDFTRARPLQSYDQGIRYLRDCPELTDVEKAALMGGSLRRYFNWPAPGWTKPSLAR
ncbi:MAG: amidohydrolase [Betaproteobacteria bacterium]|nr:amidohydrolase [Betaproteobacteria bacterium]